MYLTGTIQRQRLFELATRWFFDHPLPGDGEFVTQVFVFEPRISGPTGWAFLNDIQRVTDAGPVCQHRLHTKDELRQMILASSLNPTPRMRELAARFRSNPEEFFPRTPADLLVATRMDGTIQAMLRVKRFQRTAEKVSRRLADWLAGTIRATARSLAEGRAARAGITLEELITAPDLMTEEFTAAEEIVSQTFRDRVIRIEPDDLRVDDWLGFKFVGADADLERIEKAIRARPGTRVVRKDVHHGRYRDTKLLVDLELPPVAAILDEARGLDWSFAAARGLRPEALPNQFRAYVESGARTIRAEVILTTVEELFESEFGRAIHEARVLEQRRSRPYSGRIARNAAYLIEFLFMLAVSPTIEVDELPIRMWGRYLPDVLYQAIWRLFGVIPGGELVDSLALAHPRSATRAPSS